MANTTIRLRKVKTVVHEPKKVSMHRKSHVAFFTYAQITKHCTLRPCWILSYTRLTVASANRNFAYHVRIQGCQRLSSNRTVTHVQTRQHNQQRTPHPHAYLFRPRTAAQVNYGQRSSTSASRYSNSAHSSRSHLLRRAQNLGDPASIMRSASAHGNTLQGRQ